MSVGLQASETANPCTAGCVVVVMVVSWWERPAQCVRHAEQLLLPVVAPCPPTFCLLVGCRGVREPGSHSVSHHS